MKTILQSTAMILLIAVGSFAQPSVQPSVRTVPAHRVGLQSLGSQSGPLSTKNYQLELTIQRGEKVARYKLTLNGGSVSTELMDRFAERVSLLLRREKKDKRGEERSQKRNSLGSRRALRKIAAS